MKANKTKHLIYELTQIAFGNRYRDNKRLNDMCQLADAEIQELERLAEIGRATEKAYDEGYDLNVNVHPARYRFKNIQSLLEWAESEGK